jgi:hypothetical protein
MMLSLCALIGADDDFQALIVSNPLIQAAPKTVCQSAVTLAISRATCACGTRA